MYWKYIRGEIMRYLAIVFWSVLISFVVSYVLTSMADGEFSLPGTLALAAIFSIAAIVLGDVILKEEKSE